MTISFLHWGWRFAVLSLLALAMVLAVCSPAWAAPLAAAAAPLVAPAAPLTTAGASPSAAAAPLTEVGAVVVGGKLKDILPHPSLALLYVCDAESNQVVEVDLTTGLVVRRFQLEGSPVGLLFSDDASRLYVAEYYGKRVVILDVDTGTQLAESGDLDHPWDLALVTGPDGKRLLAVTEHYGDTAALLDPITLSEEASIETGYWPYQMAVDEEARRLYIVSYGSYAGGELQCIDLDTLTEVWRRPTGRGSFDICLDAERGRVWVTDNVGSSVSEFTTTGVQVDRYTLVGRPMGAVLDGTNGWLAAALQTTGVVCGLDLETGRKVFNTRVGRLPLSIRALPSGYQEWGEAVAVGHEGDGTISILASADPLADFLDVPADHIFAREIRVLALRGALSGYQSQQGSTFLPDQPLTRAQMAKILVTSLALHTEQVEPGAVDFVDVPPSGEPFPYDYVQEAAAYGIVRGFPGDPPRFGPWEEVTRVQLVRMAVRAAASVGSPLPPAAGDSSPFSDIPPGHPDYDVVMTAYAAGLVSGSPGEDGLLLFNPDQPVTRGQTAKIMCRLLGALGEVSGQ